MPNHCLNKLKIEGESAKVQEFFQAIKADKADDDGSFSPFDFNKIIPMPESLNIVSGSTTDEGIAILDPNSDEAEKYLGYNWVNAKGEKIKTYEMLVEHLKGRHPKDLDECLKMGRTALDNLKEYGCKDWYSWSVKNWGTKWGAYDFVEVNNEPDIENYEIVFNTAWSPPVPVIEKLGELFPDLSFTLHYFEPGAGFAGCLEVEGDESSDNYTENPNSVQAIGEEEFGMEPWEENENEDSEDE